MRVCEKDKEKVMKKYIINILKTAFCLLLCLVMCLPLFSCKEDEPAETTDTQGEEPPFVLTAENIADYRIVVPDRQASAYNDAAIKLQRYLKTTVGVELEIASDIVVKGSDVYRETEHEILLGRTERDVISQVYEGIRGKDSGYALADGKIVLVGEGVDTVEASVELFYREVLSKAVRGEAELLREGESKIAVGAYTYLSATVGGVGIEKYTVVYPASSKLGEKAVAEELCRWVELNTGHVISAVSDSKPASEYEIHIGNTSRISADMMADMESKGMTEEHFYLSQKGGLLWATGTAANSLRRAVSELTRSFSEGGDLSISAPVCKKVSQLDMTVMSYNVRGVTDGSLRNSENVIVSIRSKSPDVFALQEATSVEDAPSAKWISRMESAFGNEYGVVLGLYVGKFSSYQPIYYKKDKFELVASGSKYLTNTPDEKSMLEGQSEYYRIVTFAVLRDKQSGVEFVYSNNHFDISGYAVRTEEAKILAKLLKDYPLLPVIAGGDYNTNMDSSPMDTLMQKTGLSLGSDVATVKPQTNSSTVSDDYKSINSGDIIDHVFVSAQNIKVHSYDIWDNKMNGSYPSDHLPVILSLTVNF